MCGGQQQRQNAQRVRNDDDVVDGREHRSILRQAHERDEAQKDCDRWLESLKACEAKLEDPASRRCEAKLEHLTSRPVTHF